MLVLSRKSSERILIGDNIAIEVRRIAGNRVTIAVDAPRDIRILRGELEAAATEFEEPANAAFAEHVAEEPISYQVSHHRVPLGSLSVDAAPASAVG